MSVAINRAVLLKNRTTPSENVDSGEAYFWLEGNELKYKGDDQVTRVLATGVTPEEVQDIIGTFITSGNNKLSVTYNDAGNVLILSVVESNIVHQNISGAGTNTHAQIDAHIASTSNPHNTTASQVGAYTTAQTDTAIANAIASHVASPDPHSQYATNSELNLKADETTQINTTDGLQGGGDLSANRTLSLTNTGVVAGTYGGGNVPQLTVDAKGRITSASNGPSLVLGDQFEQGSDNTAFTTTSNANQIAASFTTGNKPAGLYRLGMQWNWNINSTSSDAIFGIYIDGVLVSPEFRKEPQEQANQSFPWSWFIYQTFAFSSTHTIELRTRTENAGATISVFDVSYELWRVN